MKDTALKYIFKNLCQRILITIIAVPSISFAQIDPQEELEPWYQFEMLIFAYDQPNTQEILRKSPFEQTPLARAFDTEYSLDELFMPAEEKTNLIDQIPSASDTEAEDNEEQVIETPELLPVLDGEPMLLAKYAEMLKYRRAYRVMWHKAWKQPLPPNSETRKYTFQTGSLITKPPEAASDIVDQSMSPGSDELDILMDQIAQNPQASRGFPLDASVDLDTSVDIVEPTPYQLAKQELTSQAPHRRQLQGSVNVYRKAFAHIEFDLWFAEIDPYIAPITVKLMKETWPVVAEDETTDISGAIEEPAIASIETEQGLDLDTIAPIEPEFEIYTEDAYTASRFGHINEDRRIRSTELYYVDHPLFGIVLKMDKVAHPLATEEDPEL